MKKQNSIKWFTKLGGLVVLALLILNLTSVQPVHAANFIVDSTADTNDANVGDGNCDDGSGDCTLRAAIEQANALGGPDTITFDTALSGQIIRLGSQLAITGDTTIDGSSLASQVSISGDTDSNNTPDVQVFVINPGATVSLNALTIARGTAAEGGGVLNNGVVTISNSTISNHVGAGSGGALRNAGTGHFGNLAITMTILNSTIMNNTGGYGGGIANGAGTLVVANSTFSGNSVPNFGGAIYLDGTANTFINNTFSGNSAGSGGSSIRNNNSMTLTNNILANSAGGADCSNGGTISPNTSNLIEDNTCTPALSGDPNLGALANNGGPTQTFALLTGSPAMDAGNNTSCAAAPINNLDQRGVARPQGGQCDIGAYEYVSLVMPGTNGGDGPGGVGATTGTTALNLWLNANNISGVDTAPVPTWADNSGNMIDFNQGSAANQPTLQTPINSNGQKVVNFDGIDDVLSGGDNLGFQPTDPHSMFIIANDPTTDDVNYLFSKMDDPGAAPSTGWDYFVRNTTFVFNIFSSVWSSNAIAIRYDTIPLGNDFHIEAFTYSGSSIANGYAFWDDGEIAPIGNIPFDTLSGSTVTTAPVQIGNRFNGGPTTFFDGGVGEIVVFNTALNDVQRILVENYLSSKYNIAISNDRYDGDTILNGNFDLNVAGIGQFGGNQHTQAHAAGMIVVNDNFLQDDGDWLLFGHRTPVNGNSTSDLPTTGVWSSVLTAPNPQRWERHYYIDVTDDTTTVDCSIAGTCYVDIIFDYSEGDMDNNPAKLPSGLPSNYRLLKRTGTSGAFSDIATATAIVGDQVHFQGVDVLDLGSNFTLGTLNAVDSPTAVTLNSFTTDNQSLSLFAVLLVGVLTLGLGSLWLRKRVVR